jgi:hypothetical protein
MAYTDFAEALEAFRTPISRLSALYEEVRNGIEQAVQVDDAGAVTINEVALREGIRGILPPGSDGTAEVHTLTRGLEMGCAMSRGEDHRSLVRVSFRQSCVPPCPLGLGLQSGARQRKGWDGKYPGLVPSRLSGAGTGSRRPGVRQPYPPHNQKA